SAFDSLFQANPHLLSHVLSDGFANRGLDRQLVRAITHRHERTPKWVTIDRPSDLHQAPSTEELDRTGHDYVRPAPFFGTLSEGGGELLVHRAPPVRVSLIRSRASSRMAILASSCLRLGRPGTGKPIGRRRWTQAPSCGQPPGRR